jgi:hypothetical protein
VATVVPSQTSNTVSHAQIGGVPMAEINPWEKGDFGAVAPMG